MRLLALCAGALMLAGCAEISLSGLSGDAPPAKPKTILVSDFVFSPEVGAVDRGYTAKLDRKIGPYPTFERKQRTLERVNDEIIASIVVALREAGLEAQTGAEDSLTLKDDALLVSGKLRAADANAKPLTVGFGTGRGGVVADMALSSLASRGKRALISFSAEVGRQPGATPPARNVAIMAVATAAGSPAERLSPDVETPARSLGRAIAEKVIAYARDNGWIEKPAEPEPKSAKPQAKKKPAAAPKPDAAAEPKD